MALGRLFFARVTDPDVEFDPDIHALEDLTVFGVRVSHARRECAIISLDCLYPEGGLLGSARWGILSIERGGVPHEIARGQISGFPLALAGQTVSVDLMCRRSDHIEKVDALFAARNSEVPVELMDMSVARRTEAFILDEVYHDRRTLNPSLEPIAGGAAPALTLYGEGSDPDQSRILSMSIQITDTPASRITVRTEAHFEEQAWGQFDAASPHFASIDPARQLTYTPEALRNSMSAVQLDGGFERLASGIETVQLAGSMTVFTTQRGVDPRSCNVIHSKKVQFPEHRIDSMSLECAVSALQPRREILEITVESGIVGYSGEMSALDETIYVADMEARARTARVMSYQTGRGRPVQFVRRGVAPSVFSSGGDFRESCTDIAEAIARYGARQLIERAHCIQIVVSVPAEDILDIDLRDRVRIVDVRLPGGQAVGKVAGWDIEIGETAVGQLVLACPISSGSGDTASVDVSDIRVVGDISIDSTPTLDAVKTGDAFALVTRFELVDAAPEQIDAIGGSTPDEPIPDPETQIPQTGVLVEFVDLVPTDYDVLDPTRVRLADFPLTLPQGIMG